MFPQSVFLEALIAYRERAISMKGIVQVKHSVLVLILLAVLFLSACSPVAPLATVEGIGQQVSASGGSYTDVSALELQTMLQDKDFTFVNVHIPFEGNITQTDLSIPYDQIADNLDQLPDKQSKIVLYCRSGRMSAIAAETLVGLSYTNVWNLSGGMVDWEQAGFKIDK
jgi:rhodanese-related sulfurtransferase